jgi:DNA-binding response OmpR family regulator
LTAREYELLVFMARNARRVLSRDMLLSRVWEQDFAVTTNVVECTLATSARRWMLPGEKRLIHTVRGAGYVLRSD